MLLDDISDNIPYDLDAPCIHDLAHTPSLALG
jgi:hypothetical protein